MSKVYMSITRVLTMACICLCTIVACSETTSAHTDNQHGISRFIRNERVAIKYEYFGELVLHPGVAIGVEYMLSNHKWISVHWNNDLGGFWHRWNNTSFFLKSSIGTRFSKGPLFADLNVGIGYMHSFAAGPIYQKSSSGKIEKARNLGHAHFIPNASFLLGWGPTHKKMQSWRIHVGPEVYLQSSYNHIYLPHVATKVGFTYKLK